ncbi:hypothetical protein MHYP_G00015910 [Metynnis hypsauchen]
MSSVQDRQHVLVGRLPGPASGSDEAVECARKAAEAPLQWGAVRMRGLVLLRVQIAVTFFSTSERNGGTEAETEAEAEGQRGGGSGLHCCVQFVLHGRQELVSPGGPGETLKEKNPRVTGGVSPRRTEEGQEDRRTD